MEKFYLEVWQYHAPSKKAFRVRQEITIAADDIKTQVSNFLGNYLLECYRFGGTGASINKHNIATKINELEIIQQVFEQKKFEAEIYAVKYFVKFSNFVPA